MSRPFDLSGIRSSHLSPRRRRSPRLSLERLEQRALLSTLVLLNEVNAVPYPATFPNQYAEIATVDSGTGAPVGNVSLSGYQFVRFDGYDNGSPVGKALLVIDLSAYSTGGNGLLILEADNSQPGQPPFQPGPPVPDPATTVVHVANFDLGGSGNSLGINTNTYAVVNYNGGTALNQDQAYDPSNTGTLTLPTGDSFSDGISFTYQSQPSNPTDRAYLAYLDVPTSISPSAATRVLGSTTVSLTPGAALGAGSQWYGGYLLAYSTNFDSTNAVNLPSNGGELTPGWLNVPVAQVSSPVYSATRPSVGSKTLNLTLNVVNGTVPSGATVQVNTFDITASSGSNYTPITNSTVAVTANSTTIPITIRNGSLKGQSYLAFGVVVARPQLNGSYSNRFLIAPAAGGMAAGSLYSVEQPSIATAYIAASGTAPKVVIAARVMGALGDTNVLFGTGVSPKRKSHGIAVGGRSWA